MTEVDSSPDIVVFADIAPADLLSIPAGAHADYLPHDLNRTHALVGNLMLLAPLDRILAADTSLPAAPWHNQRRVANEVTPNRLINWRNGLEDVEEELQEVDLFVQGAKLWSLRESTRRLQIASWYYQELIDLSTAVGKWSPTVQEASHAMLATELTMVDPVPGWLRWNTLARRFNQRKVTFIDETLQNYPHQHTF